MSGAAPLELAGERRLRTPAKINLGLRLTGRRADGYHLLESLFVPVALWDELAVAVEPGPDETLLDLALDPGAGLPPALAGVEGGPTNLAHRAAEAFRAATGLRGRVRIALTKWIPAGAGLGGGSSDAAAVLVALASLAEAAGQGVADLPGLALELGADVPFFLAPGPAHVSGIGEVIEPLDGLPEWPVVLANPGISVGTAEVYRLADRLSDSLTPAGAGSTMRAFSRLRSKTGDARPALGDLLVNDLAPAAIHLCPSIGSLIDQMRAMGAIGASMSGSGGTVFGVFEEAGQAARAAAALREGSPEGARSRSDAEPTTPTRTTQHEDAQHGPAGAAWVCESRLIGRDR